MKDYVPNPLFVARAVALWVEMLSTPSTPSVTTLMDPTFDLFAKEEPKDQSKMLAAFAVELHDVLMHPLKYSNPFDDSKSTLKIFDQTTVDYEPNPPLREAARRAGFQGPWPPKCRVFLRPNCLEVCVGYGGPFQYHYPLSDGRWLVAHLTGPDVPKIVALIEAGHIDLDLKPILKS